MKKLKHVLQELNNKGYIFISHSKLSGGINSAVYKVENIDKRAFALKLYPEATKNNPRNRCLAETRFLNYLQTCSINTTPKLEESNTEKGWALLSWIEGKKPTTLGTTDLQEIANFIHAINDKSTNNDRAQLDPASEACLSLPGLVESIDKRIKKLQHISTTTTISVEAKQWINTILEPYFKSVSSGILNQKSGSKHWQVSTMNKIASPSDVGIHNMLRTEKGLYFLDFEYAGLDDLSKLAADWILQPQHRLDLKQEQQFCAQLLTMMKSQIGASWQDRLNDIKPLIHIKWTLIMLNKMRGEDISKQHFPKAVEYFETK